MESTKYIYWQDEGQWLGYLQTILISGRKGSRSRICNPIVGIFVVTC